MRVPRSFPVRSAVLFGLVTWLMTWPMGSAPEALYSIRQDSFLGIWNLWWVAGSLTDAGRDLLDTELLFHPFGTGLEVQPLSLLQTIGVAPLTLLLGPIVAFNALVLGSFWFGGWMTSLLARDLTGSAPGACIAGLVFSFSPFHYTYLPELNLLPIGLLPLYLWLCLRFQREPSWKRAVLAGMALALVGLGSWYFGIAAGMLGLALSLGRIKRGCFARDRADAALERGTCLRLELLHWLSSAALLGPFALRLARGFLGKHFEQLPDRDAMGLVMENFKATGFTIALWSYIGLLALALAAYGCLQFKQAVPLLFLTLASFVLSLGKSASIAGITLTLPFALLSRLPLFDSLRYPDRFFVLTQLGIALLACLGFQRLSRRWKPGDRARLWLAAGLGTLMLLEYWPGRLHSEKIPDDLFVPVATAQDAGAVFHIPARLRSRDGEHMLQQWLHGRPIAGGYLTRRDQDLIAELEADPFIGPLLGDEPGTFPPDLREGLRQRGFSYVAVQKQDLFVGTNMLPSDLRGPFVFGGSKFLEQRLFPGYQNPGETRKLGQAWIRALFEELGTPVVRGPRGALFHLSAP